MRTPQVLGAAAEESEGTDTPPRVVDEAPMAPMVDTGRVAPVELRDAVSASRTIAVVSAGRDTIAPAPQLSGATPLDALELLERAPSTVSIEARKLVMSSSFTVNRARTLPSTLTDFAAAGVLLRASDQIAYGLEVGHERYPQTLPVRDTSIFQIDQQPNVAWLGAALRYSPGTVESLGLSPFVQGTFGLGFSHGAMLRGRAGVRLETDLGLSLVNNVGANIGVEASALSYKYNGQYLLSGRYGASIGLEVGF
jgi:hypothetical protein